MNLIQHGYRLHTKSTKNACGAGDNDDNDDVLFLVFIRVVIRVIKMLCIFKAKINLHDFDAQNHAS